MHRTHDPASPPAPEIAFDGFPDADARIVLVQPSRPVPDGGRLL